MDSILVFVGKWITYPIIFYFVLALALVLIAYLVVERMTRKGRIKRSKRREAKQRLRDMKKSRKKREALEKRLAKMEKQNPPPYKQVPYGHSDRPQ
jgi:Flp pilus assembly protein TadB